MNYEETSVRVCLCAAQPLAPASHRKRKDAQHFCEGRLLFPAFGTSLRRVPLLLFTRNQEPKTRHCLCLGSLRDSVTHWALPDVLGHKHSWLLSHTSDSEMFCGNKSAGTIHGEISLLPLCLKSWRRSRFPFCSHSRPCSYTSLLWRLRHPQTSSTRSSSSHSGRPGGEIATV